MRDACGVWRQLCQAQSLKILKVNYIVNPFTWWSTASAPATFSLLYTYWEAPALGPATALHQFVLRRRRRRRARCFALAHTGSHPTGQSTRGVTPKSSRLRRAGTQPNGQLGEVAGVPLYRPSGMIAGSHVWPSDVVSATSAYSAGEPAWSEMALATPGAVSIVVMRKYG